MYFTTGNQFVLLILMIGKYHQLAFEKEKKIEAEAYEIRKKEWKESIKKALVSDSWRCVAWKKKRCRAQYLLIPSSSIQVLPFASLCSGNSMQNMYAAPEIAAHCSKGEHTSKDEGNNYYCLFFPFAPQMCSSQICPTRKWKRSDCEGIGVRRKTEVAHCNIINILRYWFGFELSWEWRLC